MRYFFQSRSLQKRSVQCSTFYRLSTGPLQFECGSFNEISSIDSLERFKPTYWTQASSLFSRVSWLKVSKTKEIGASVSIEEVLGSWALWKRGLLEDSGDEVSCEDYANICSSAGITYVLCPGLLSPSGQKYRVGSSTEDYFPLCSS